LKTLINGNIPGVSRAYMLYITVKGF